MSSANFGTSLLGQQPLYYNPQGTNPYTTPTVGNPNAGGMGATPTSYQAFNPANYLVDPNQGNIGQSATGTGANTGTAAGSNFNYANMTNQQKMAYNTANINQQRANLGGSGFTGATWSGALGSGSIAEPAGSTFGGANYGGNFGPTFGGVGAGTPQAASSYTAGGAGARGTAAGAGGAGGYTGGQQALLSAFGIGAPTQAGQTVQGLINSANTENNTRYNQELTLAGQENNTAIANNNLAWQKSLANVTNSATSRGIGNTTVLPSLQNAVNATYSNTAANAANQGDQTAIGIINARTDQAPGLNLLASLLASPGSTGAYGLGGSRGGGQAGGGAGLNPASYLNNSSGGASGGSVSDTSYGLGSNQPASWTAASQAQLNSPVALGTYGLGPYSANGSATNALGTQTVGNSIDAMASVLQMNNVNTAGMTPGQMASTYQMLLQQGPYGLDSAGQPLQGSD